MIVINNTLDDDLQQDWEKFRRSVVKTMRRQQQLMRKWKPTARNIWLYL